MKYFEATISHAIRQMVLEAIKSNQYAAEFPTRAEECTRDARFYAEWLSRNGRKVEIILAGSRVDRISVDDEVLVDDGCLAG